VAFESEAELIDVVDTVGQMLASDLWLRVQITSCVVLSVTESEAMLEFLTLGVTLFRELFSRGSRVQCELDTVWCQLAALPFEKIGPVNRVFVWFRWTGDTGHVERVSMSTERESR